MTRQTYTAPTVATAHSIRTHHRPNPSMESHSQFLPADRATQVLLQQFL